MQQLQFDFRPSLSVQLELPFDYTESDNYYANKYRNESVSLTTGGGLYLTCSSNAYGWSGVSISPDQTFTTIRVQNIVTDTIVVNKPAETIFTNALHFLNTHSIAIIAISVYAYIVFKGLS